MVQLSWVILAKSGQKSLSQHKLRKKLALSLKGHSQLLHMRITYHFKANLHIALHIKKRPWNFESKYFRNAYIRAKLGKRYHGECSDERGQGKPKVNEYLGSRRIRRCKKHLSARIFFFSNFVLHLVPFLNIEIWPVSLQEYLLNS